MVEIQELVLTRISVLQDEVADTTEIIESKVAIHPLDISFLDEYIGPILDTSKKDVINIYLYTGDVIVVRGKLKDLLLEINKRRAKIKSSEFFRKGN